MLTTIVLMAAAIGIGVLIMRGAAGDPESKAYAEAAVRAIAADWKKAELLDRATPELAATAKPAELDAWFANLSRLGRPLEFAEAKAQGWKSLHTLGGSTVQADYAIDARFQNGDATFRIGLLKRDGVWRIRGFFVDLRPGPRKEQTT
ncbi:MAG: hypothetical protein L6R19_00635 [Alphaproteobacteria bacterium]|nr:hypothetical protein [Alphaproteobacteria bacterium]